MATTATKRGVKKRIVKAKVDVEVIGGKISNQEVRENIQYVLEVFLEQYLQFVGAPKIGKIQATAR